ncbi:MAG: hypothetical protein JSW52_11800 [Candidatus Coatesbacteria bacterium]|nr:MAG: hypothetical protein JSW52_11800 [Candidatus Coatesbacteria bacterium]
MEFIEVDCWDTAAAIGNWKFNMLDGNPVRFLFTNLETSDWNAWKITTSSGVPQTFIIGPTGYCYLSKLGYGGTYSEFEDAFDAVIYGDEDPPYLEDMNPEDGDTDVSLSYNISGHIIDDNYGLDEDSIEVDVYTLVKGDIPGDLNLSGDFLDTSYSFNPDDPLPHYIEVFVYVAASDLARHDMEDEYSFWTRSFDLNEPDDGEVFEVTGPRSGAGETVRAATGSKPVIVADGGRTGYDVTFEWDEVIRADSYELIVDDNDDFSSPEVHETGITDIEYTHTFDVTDDITYYWYVICNAPDDDFDSRDTFSFSFDYNTNITPASLGSIKVGFTE